MLQYYRAYMTSSGQLLTHGLCITGTTVGFKICLKCKCLQGSVLMSPSKRKGLWSLRNTLHYEGVSVEGAKDLFTLVLGFPFFPV